jgi:tetratricopeptide (TPR) repeat protein
MPAVGLVRAAVGYWENNGLVDRVKAWQKTDKESDASKAERLSLVVLYNRVAQLRQAAERNAMRDADVCYYLGLAEKKLTDYDAARKWTLQALKLSPDREDVQILANDVLYLAKDPAILSEVLDKLCAKYPKNGSFEVRRGFLHANKGDQAAAKKSFESALACEDLSLSDRGLALCLSGKPQDAIELLNEDVRRKSAEDSTYVPTEVFRLYQIIALKLGGDLEKSTQEFKELISRNKGFLDSSAIQFDIPAELIEVLKDVQKATLERFPDLVKKPAE